ncbi:MAG: MBL fold metallo-hydrolase, partial [Deltaproteobacteria bacterium]|nr:MBL fold metallo-hydrolase [Deltaproteobacteria bacterium]
MKTKAFFDSATYTLTYVVYDPDSKDAVVIDPVLDLDVRTWRISNQAAKQVQEFVRQGSLNVRWVLDTHAHADHLSGTQVLKEAFGAPTAIGSEIKLVQKTFAGAFNLKDVPVDGSQWDQLLDDGHQLEAGSLKVEAIHTPG